MALDWRDQTRNDVITFEMVSPTNVDQTLGELEGVILSGSTISAEYYTDTRTSGSVHVLDGNWVRGSMVRVVHSVPEWNYRNEIGTYIVTDDPATRTNGSWVTELTLHSRLYGLSTDKHPRPWTIATNARALKAMEQILKSAGFQYKKLSPKDKTYKSPVVIEGGTPRLTSMFDLANAANDRIDVDGHGRVTIAPYVNPASKTAKFRIDLADTRGVAQDGIRRTTDWLGMADVVVVSHKYSKGSGSKASEQEITGIARVSSSTHQAHTKRGYTVTNFESLSEMEPKTSARAQQLAKERLAKEQRELVEWEIETVYLPIWEGDVVELVVHDGLKTYRGVRKCLVKSLDINLERMTMALTLKETASGDKGDEDE